MIAGQEALMGRVEIIPRDDARVCVALVVAFDKLSGLVGVNAAGFFISHFIVFLPPNDRKVTIETMFDHILPPTKVPPPDRTARTSSFMRFIYSAQATRTNQQN